MDERFELVPVSYSIPGAALATGLGERTIRKYIHAGAITVRYSGTKPLIERDELAAFVRALPTEKPS